MKSPYQISKELKVSPQSIYQKIDRMKDELNPYIQRDGKKILISEEGESLIKSTFQSNVEQEVEQVKQNVEQGIEQDIFNQLNKQLNTEIEYLREQNKTLLSELGKEREHSRQQAEHLAELFEKHEVISEKLAELTKNEQILMLQSKTNHLLSEEPAETISIEKTDTKQEKPLSFWQKLFRNSKRQ